MKKSDLLSCFVIFLASCASYTPEEQQQARQKLTDDYEVALARFDDAKKQECITDFKRTMNDPSSFELAGELTLDRWMSMFLRDRAYSPLGVSLYPYQKEIVVFTASVRGRNAYGGLVLNKMNCMFGVVEGNLVFSATQQP